MKKPKRRAQSSARRNTQRQRDLNQRDSLRFYKSVVAAITKRADATLMVSAQEFQSLKGSLQWRRMEDGGVEFNFVSAEESG